MAYSEVIAERIRGALAHLPDVKEKKMFGGLAFLVNGKMCLTAGPERMMCRIDPNIHDGEVTRDGCTTVVMKGREYKGYIYVSEESLKQDDEFKHWIKLALDFNEALPSNEKQKIA